MRITHLKSDFENALQIKTGRVIIHMMVFTDLSVSEKEVSPVRIEAVFLCL